MPKKAKGTKAREKTHGAATRSMWNGSITFGLVQIPVGLYPSEVSHDLSFKLLDRRDLAPVRYQRTNSKSGKPIAWKDIVRGYERSPGEFVVVTDEDLRRANVRATQTIDILDFVDAGSVAPSYFEKPYYIAPLQSKKGSSPKAYVLLREALRKTGKIGIAKVVIRTREHLAAVLPEGKALILDLLRFDHELRKEEDIDLPEDTGVAKAGSREMEMAERLITEMASEWKPERYKDEYYDDVMKMIEKKAKAGEAHKITEPEEAPAIEEPADDIISLLRKSLGGKGNAPANRVKPEPRAKRGAAKAAPRKKGGGLRKAA
jgi:DNA end-binding protein Ku